MDMKTSGACSLDRVFSAPLWPACQKKNNPLASFTSGTACVSAISAVTRPAQGIK
jgi:hypothetical protein